MCRWALLLVVLAATVAVPAGCAAPPSLRAADGGYEIRPSFADYYDGAFVLSGGADGPRLVTVDELAAALMPYDVVVYGELHDHPGVHLGQMRLLRALYARNPRWTLSFEQFERDTQGVVDAYLAGRIGEQALLDDGRAWSNYQSAYRPLLVFAKLHDLPVVAAEAPEWAVNCIGQYGSGILAEFTPQERSWVAADLHTGPGAYRDRFMQFQAGSTIHGGGADTPESAQRAERSYAAQAARDDTMAESISVAIKSHPDRKVLHFTGTFHAADFLGTVERLRLRNADLKVAVIEPVEVDNPGAPRFEREKLSEATVLELVYPSPETFVEGEDMSAWIRRMQAKHKAGGCKYAPPP